MHRARPFLLKKSRCHLYFEVDDSPQILGGGAAIVDVDVIVDARR
jgi:hypothetical protein